MSNLLIYSWVELKFNFSFGKCLLVLLSLHLGYFLENSNYKFTNLLNINGYNLHVLQQILSTFTNVQLYMVTLHSVTASDGKRWHLGFHHYVILHFACNKMITKFWNIISFAMALSTSPPAGWNRIADPILVNVYLIHLKLKFVLISIFDLSLLSMHMSTQERVHITSCGQLWPRFWFGNSALISHIVSIQPQGINLIRHGQ